MEASVAYYRNQKGNIGRPWTPARCDEAKVLGELTPGTLRSERPLPQMLLIG